MSDSHARVAGENFLATHANISTKQLDECARRIAMAFRTTKVKAVQEKVQTFNYDDPKFLDATANRMQKLYRSGRL